MQGYKKELDKLNQAIKLVNMNHKEK